MSSSIKRFKNFMKVEEIRGQRILTSFLSPENSNNLEIFAKNIPEFLDENYVVPFFETVGPVQKIRIMMKADNEGNRGFAYVNYLSAVDADRAIKYLNGSEIIKNHRVTVTHSMNNCRIFLGGIPVMKTKDEVWQELEKRGITDIVDVIMYRSYNNRAKNRGFVFVEFPSHQYAARMRNKMKGMCLWNNEVIVDWSVPEVVVPDEDMKKVKILYIRNLNVMESKEYMKAVIENYVNPQLVNKVYKYKNYAFVHLDSRDVAEELLIKLRDHYRNTQVEVTFAKPPTEYTKPEYRKQMLKKSSNCDRMKTETSQSSDYDLRCFPRQETSRKSKSPLQDIGNFPSLKPRNDNLFVSNKSSYFSTYEDLVSLQRFSAPTLRTDLSFLPPNHLQAEKDTECMKWCDLLKKDERYCDNVVQNAGLNEASSVQSSGLKILDRPLSSYLMGGIENMASLPIDLSYPSFESSLQERRREVKTRQDTNEGFGLFESSPQRRMDTMMINDIWGTGDANASQFTPWGAVHSNHIDKTLKPFSSFENNSARDQQSLIAPQSFHGADTSSMKPSDEMNFDTKYINDLLSD